MKQFLTSALTFALLVAGAAQTVKAAVIAGFDIPQAASGYTSIAPNPGGPVEITASSLSRSPTLVGSSFSNHFYYSGWGPSVDLSKYYSVTLTVAPGSILNLSDVTFSVEDTAGGGLSTFSVRTSLDGFSTNVDTFVLSNVSGNVVSHTTNLTGLGPITGAVDIRFYGTTINPSVLLGFANHLLGGSGGGLPDVGQNIRFNGTITPAPEPASMLAWGLIAGVGAVGYRLRRRKVVES